MRRILLFFVPLLFCVFVSNAQLTNPDNNAALQVVSANKVQLGLSADFLNNVKVTNTYLDNTSGIRYVYLLQTYQGIPVYNQMMVLSFKNDKLLSNAGSFNQSIEKLVNVKTTTPSVSPESAVQSALSDKGFRATQMAIAIKSENNGQKIEFGNMGICRENITAQLMWVPVEDITINKVTKIQLAWQVYFIPKTTSDFWLVRVDATNNSILGTTNLTDYDTWGHSPAENASLNYPAFMTFSGQAELVAQPCNKNLFDFKKPAITEDPKIITTATYRVVPFPAESPIAPGGAHALRTDPWLAAPGNATTLKWHTGVAGADYDYTRSNNVWSYHDNVAPFNTAPSIAKSASSTTPLPNLTFNFTPDYTVAPNQSTPVQNQQFNITNLFYWNNIFHDIMYIYGFTEAAANFQADNLGRGGAGNDYVRGEAQDGGGTNNANFSTPPDGGNGIMQMYLWNIGGSNPLKDGDVDNGIVMHEHGHGLSNRLTGGGTTGCLGNAEQMGEGWSDYYAMMFTQNWSTSNLNTGFSTPRGLGLYALNGTNLFGGSPPGTGIRHFPYCTNFAINSQVYLANLPASAHDRGEIWCATLWDMTWNIINQVGSINANLYDLAGGGGNNIAMKLVTEGMKLQQCSPGFISGRNAILAADQALYGGAYNCAIWEAFRRRGMGAFASEGSTSSVNDQIPDYTAPSTLGALVSATTIPEGQTLTYTNTVTTCGAITGYTLRDTLPLNVTYLSGGTYDAVNRVVSFPVTQGAGSTNYVFSVTVNLGSYYPPVILFDDVVGATIPPATWSTTSTTASVWASSTARSHSAPNSYYSVNTPVISDQRLFFTNNVALPATPPDLSFWHWFSTEGTYDGGILEVSTNGGGTYAQVPNSGIAAGGYTGVMDPTTVLAGQQAWTGGSNGWEKVRVPLTPYASQNVKFRWRSTTDLGTNAEGWYVDDIAIKNIATVYMRSSLFNAANLRLSYKDMETEITQFTVCAPTINTQPTNSTICQASTTSFTCVGAATVPVTYQWQLSTAGAGGPWNNLTNVAPYSGVTTSTLTINPTAVGMNGYQYRCIVTGGCAPNATSTAAILNVIAASVGGTVTPANSNVCGLPNSGTLTLSGQVGNILNWESATNIAGPYTPIANTTTTLSFTNLGVTTYYRAVVQVNGCVAVTSSIATVTFTAALPLSIVATPGSTLCQGDPALLTVMEASGPPTPATVSVTGFTNNNANATILFNFRNNNSFAVTITGIESICGSAGLKDVSAYYKASAINGLPGALNAANGWNLFGAALITGIANTTTAATQPFMSGLTLVIPAGATYGICVQAVNQGTTTAAQRYSTIAAGTYTFSTGGCDIITGTNVGYGGIAVPGAPTFTPRGFMGKVIFTTSTLVPVTTGTFSWSPAAGLNQTTGNPVAASPAVTTTYTVLHNNGAGCVRQGNITITVNTRPAVTAQPANVTVCNGTTATFTVGATATGITYQWEESTNGGVSYTALANAAPYSGVNTATLTINPVTVAMNNNRYRCVISGTCPPAANSNGAILSVNALPVITVTPASGCGGVAGISGLLLTASGANTYTWAPLGGLYTNAITNIPYAGTNTPTVYAAPTAFTTYIVTGTNTTTGCSNTAQALVNYTPPAPTVVPSSVTMCLGDPAVKLKSSSSQAFSATFNSGALSLVVPDGPATWPQTLFPGVITPNLAVAGIPANATITAMSVKLNMTHTYIADMVIVLKAPNGAVFNLDANINKTGGAGANFVNTVISSASSTPLSAGLPPYTGTFRPDAAGPTYVAVGFTFPGGPTSPANYIPTVATFSGLYSVPNGNWTLGMYDWGAGDIGTLTNWELKIDYIIGVPATPAVWNPPAGLFSDANATVPYVAGTAVDSVWTRPTPSGVYPYTATVQSLSPPPAAVTTPMAGGNGNNTVAFNVANNNAVTMNLTGISTNTFGSGAIVARAFYKVTPIAGNPGLINAANGWIQFAGPTNSTVTAGTLNPVLTGLTLPVPASTTYGIVLELTGATLPAYTNGTGTIQTYTNNGCSIITDGNVGWGGPATPGPMVNNPRNFNGAVYLSAANVAPCTSPARTVVVTVNQPVNIGTVSANQTICTDKVASFSVSGITGSGPLSYQWQVSTNGGNTYANVTNGGVYSGATTVTLTITAPPVTMSGYFYRCIVTGAAPCAPATSQFRLLTVNPLPTIVIGTPPYVVSLFPGLRYTITSTVSPNAADPNGGYTWLRNGVAVAGANTGILNVDIDGLGTYQLRVKDVNGCTNISNIFTVKDSVSGKCFIYPNPSSGKFQVRYYSVATNVLPRSLTIYDAKGDRVFTQFYTVGRPYDRMDVDIRKYGKGLYWVEIGDMNGNRLTMCRVVIQ